MDVEIPTATELAQAPIEVQQAAFIELVLRNPVTVQLLGMLPGLQAPDCWLAGGALFQTVWNALSGRSPGEGILDYDVNYFDGSDLSFEAEDAVIQRAATVFAELDAEVEVRNEARVHLWYPQKFGVPCPPFHSTADAISCFLSTTSAFGIRTGPGGGMQVLAPFGFTDLFAMRVRPNPLLGTKPAFEKKAARWQQHWPTLQVMPWH